jgi:oxaloacetate decarboxylase gamma subunit
LNILFIEEGDTMQADLFSEGLELMVFGMGTVFTFLAILVVVTNLMSMIVQRFFPDAPEPVLSTIPRPAAPAASNDEQLLAVITAAVHKYRSRK